METYWISNMQAAPRPTSPLLPPERGLPHPFGMMGHPGASPVRPRCRGMTWSRVPTHPLSSWLPFQWADMTGLDWLQRPAGLGWGRCEFGGRIYLQVICRGPPGVGGTAMLHHIDVKFEPADHVQVASPNTQTTRTNSSTDPRPSVS
jgi:hypothetical protein